jgi:CHAT domain-containing protein
MIDPVDGVYGLQRAFKMAGVETIVMSLWKVQDDATSMLMTQFYTYLNDGTEKHQALWKAMKDVKDKYKDPYYWAGFVMLD